MKNYYTLNEIIEQTGKSRSTINRAIKELRVLPDGTFKKAYYYSPGNARKIIEAVCLDYDFSKFDNDTDLNNDSQNDVKYTSNDTQDEARTQSNETKSQSNIDQISSDYINFLKEQIKAKDKEIEKLHQLLDQSQQLQLVAQAQVKELRAESQEEELAQETEETPTQAIVGADTDTKKGFWKRLFRK